MPLGDIIDVTMTPKADNTLIHDDSSTTMNTKSVQKRVSQKDIAERVGVSRSEVSRVLSGQIRQGRGIAPEKQEQILQIAREMNYHVNVQAQTLATGRTNTVALVVRMEVGEPLAPHYQEIISAMTLTLAQYDLRLLLVQTERNLSEKTMGGLEKLVRGGICDGLVLTDVKVVDERIPLLDQLRLPYVVRGTAGSNTHYAVGMNNKAMGQLAIRTFANYGHRHVLFHNVEGFLRAGADRGVGARAEAVVQGVQMEFEDSIYKEGDIYRFVVARFSAPNPPTALFLADELAAFGALRALSDLGLRVPEDVSVLTSLNSRMLQRIVPTLSFINVRQHDVATEAAHLLARRLMGEDVAPGQRFIEPQLEMHGSVQRIHLPKM
jgi:DNA-binding LacI/PurR family transcriptional regulator